MTYSKSQDDFKLDLADQISFLRTSSRAYDNGEFAEGRRLAIALRILFFDGKGRSRAVALLTRLSIKDKLRYHSVATDIDKNITYRFYSFCLSSSEGKVY